MYLFIISFIYFVLLIFPADNKAYKVLIHGIEKPSRHPSPVAQRAPQLPRQLSPHLHSSFPTELGQRVMKLAQP